MASKIVCYCKQPFKGLGRSIIGYYKSGDKLVDTGDGRVELHRYAPVSITVYVDPVTGIFEVDNIKENREILRTSIIKGHVELQDLELQQEIVGINKVAAHTTVVEHINKEQVVQIAGKTSREAPKYGKMITNTAPINVRLENELAKYKQKKAEKLAKLEEKKTKNQDEQLPFMENLSEESEQIELDQDEKELMELLEAEEKEMQEVDKG